MSIPLEGRRIVAHPRDPIRIVPLHLPPEVVQRTPEAPAAAGPQLTYRGGPLLTNVKVFTAFWGTAWQQAAPSALAGQLGRFFQFLVGSPLMDQLAEYSTPGLTIGHGVFLGTATVANVTLKSSTTDTAIRHFLQQELAGNSSFPAPDPNTLYFVYLPPGVAVVLGGSRSCQAFCGYHDNISGQIFYAVMPYPNCTGCMGGLSTFDALTSTSSHEFCEAVTDPVPGQGWYDDVHGEIGDICAWQTRKLGSYTIQLEWSNKANACV